MTTAQVATRFRAAEGRLVAACADATSTRELLEEVDAILLSTLRAEGAFLCTTDPVSGVFNAEAVVTDLPDAMRAPWMMNEFLQDDHNKFGELRRTGVALVRSLFAKTGCSSQGELMSRLFIHRTPTPA